MRKMGIFVMAAMLLLLLMVPTGANAGVGGATEGVGGATSGVGGATSGVGGALSGVGGASVGGALALLGHLPDWMLQRLLGIAFGR